MGNFDYSWFIDLKEVFNPSITLPWLYKPRITVVSDIPGDPLLYAKNESVASIGGSSYLRSSYPSNANHYAQQRRGSSVSFDGSGYGVLKDADTGLDTTVLVVGDFTISGSILYRSTGASQGVVGGTNTDRFQISYADSPYCEINDIGATFSTTKLVDGVTYNFTLQRIGLFLTWSDQVNGSETKATSAADFPISRVGVATETLYISSSNLWDIKVTDSIGAKIDLAMVCISGLVEYSATSGLPDCAWSEFISDIYSEHIDGSGSNRLNEIGYSVRENLLTYSSDLSQSVWSYKNGAVSVGPNSFTLAASNSYVYHTNGPSVSVGDVVRFTGHISNITNTEKAFKLQLNETTAPYAKSWIYPSVIGDDIDIVSIERVMETDNKLSLAVYTFYPFSAGQITIEDATLCIVKDTDPKPLVSLGDSICKSSVQDGSNRVSRSYTHILGRHHNAITFNYGDGGDTLPETDTVIDTKVLSGASLLLIEGGINDLTTAESDPNTSMRTAMSSLIAKGLLLTDNICVFTVAWAHLNTTEIGWRDSYNEWLISEAAANNIKVCPLHELVSDEHGNQDLQYFTDDTTHLNDLGHQVVAQWLIKNLEYSGAEFRPISTASERVSGIKPGGYLGITDYPGPLGVDMEVISGTTFGVDLVVDWPRGPKFQELPESSANLDTSNFISTDNTFIGNSLAIYNPVPEDPIKVQAYVDKY